MWSFVLGALKKLVRKFSKFEKIQKKYLDFFFEGKKIEKIQKIFWFFFWKEKKIEMFFGKLSDSLDKFFFISKTVEINFFPGKVNQMDFQIIL